MEGQKSNDFYVTLYIQDIEKEENIIDLFAFKKDLLIKSKEAAQDFEKDLDELTGQTLTIEYNKPEGNEKFKLVKIEKKK